MRFSAVVFFFYLPVAIRYVVIHQRGQPQCCCFFCVCVCFYTLSTTQLEASNQKEGGFCICNLKTGI